jgi:hypothetical protein
MMMKFVPGMRKLELDLDDGKQLMVSPEMLVNLDSPLGEASREAVQHPSMTVVVECCWHFHIVEEACEFG